MKARILLALIALTFTLSAFAADLPPGRWWKRPEIIQALQLTEEQQSKLEAAYRTSADDLIDLNGIVQKSTLALRAELDQPQLDRQKIRAIAARLSEARGRLFERELMMLVDMRSVLTDAQWVRMQRILDRISNGQGQQRKLRP